MAPVDWGYLIFVTGRSTHSLPYFTAFWIPCLEDSNCLVSPPAFALVRTFAVAPAGGGTSTDRSLYLLGPTELDYCW